MKSNIKIQGFTLVELLVTVTVLGIIGLLFFSIFSNSLRGGNKAQIVLAIKQNGQSLLENMDKTIRGSDNVICVNDSTLVIIKDGVYTRYRFIAPASSTNGLIQQDNPAQPAERDIKLFVDNVCTDPMDPNSNILTDTKLDTGVSVDFAVDSLGNNLPFIERNKESGFKDVITIQFALKQGVGVASSTTAVIDPVNFKTTIQLR